MVLSAIAPALTNVNKTIIERDYVHDKCMVKVFCLFWSQKKTVVDIGDCNSSIYVVGT